MNDVVALPIYTDEELVELSPAELIDTLIENEDRVPRNVIDECARRGDEMTAYLSMLHRDGFLWDSDYSDGVWWLRLHAAMILGLIPSEQAGVLLVDMMYGLSLEEDEDMQDWLAGEWSALFRNKPNSVLPALRTLCEDRDMDWYMRANAIEALLFAASRQDAETLEQTLAWAAKMALEEDEDWDVCLTAAHMLLYFPRPQYRQLLEELVPLQYDYDRRFDMQSIERAYAGKYYAPEWERFTNPWAFYEPDAIARRQIRWREEAPTNDFLDDDLPVLSAGKDFRDDFYRPYEPVEPYVRLEPKVGRNDPCPCGSGKKYKKCCLAKE